MSYEVSDLAGGDMWSLQLPYALCRPLANARYMDTHTHTHTVSRRKNAGFCFMIGQIACQSKTWQSVK